MIPKVAIRLAEPKDVSAIADIAEQAYTLYIERIGRRPAPMDADFAAHVERGEAYVVQDRHGIGGYIVTVPKTDGQFIENVAVLAQRQGTGLGRMLCKFAELEARRRKLSRLYLYTNEKMTENLSYYAHMGFVETHRIHEDGFDRVYLELRFLS